MNRNFTEALKLKLEVEVDANFDSDFWAQVGEIEKDTVVISSDEKTPWWHIDWQWGSGLALAACLLIAIISQTINLPNNGTIQSGFVEMIEQEEILENYELLTTIEDIDELSNEEWEILLEEELDS